MAGPGGPVILWFRRDLRLADNPALNWAIRSGRPVVPVYVHDEGLEDRALGAASRWWLHGSLQALAGELEARGSALVLKSGPAPGALVELARAVGAEALVFNRLHDPGAAEREERVREVLPDLEIRTSCAGWLAEPGTVLTSQGTPFRVFTPFARALKAEIDRPDLTDPPGAIRPPPAWPDGERLGDWRLRPARPDWASGFKGEPGEAGARRRLDRFARAGFAAYPTARDAPGNPAGTSRLSPHLRFGEIAPGRVWAAVGDDAAGDRLRGELAWREFAAHLLHHFPAMPRRNLRAAFDALDWRRDPTGFAAWTRGRTGFPVVDAGMRQLWKTGWMHNRVRMIAASFLVKDLLIDWREGEAWFWDCLVDADPASNPMNWQWTAGTGVDAAPWFRIFNPALQGARFDPDGAYVRRWIPEIAALPDRWLHRPHAAPAEVLAAAEVEIGRTYPAPLVEHASARARALEAFRSLK